VITPDDVGMMTVAWGQSASNGELGLGPEEPKSSTKPTKHMPLEGIEVLQIAAGQNTTVFLVKPTSEKEISTVHVPIPNGDSKTEEESEDKYSDRPRHPEDLDGVPEVCLACSRDNGEEDSPLECDKCDNPYHLGCLKPPLSAVPPGEWFCPKCIKDPGAPLHGYVAVRPNKATATATAPTTSTPVKRKGDVDEDGDEDMDSGRSKRKASGSEGTKSNSKKKRQ